jgi:hypothetical protein
MTITDLRESMKAQIRAAEDDIKHLRAAIDAIDALDGNQPAVPKRPRRARSAPRTKASPVVVPMGKLLDLLKGSEGLTTRQVAKQSQGDSSAILALLKEQEAGGNVRRSGNRASTRWHLVTDEDRVAARAAEIAAQSKAA